jgi:hypothetical protein
MSGPVVTTDATQSTSTSTGSFVTAGGLGVVKDAYFGGTVNATGNITCPSITISNNPVNATDGANKAYVDAHGGGSNYWALVGGLTLNPLTSSWNVVTTGRIGAAQGTITGAVVNATDIATKAYVDGSIGSGYWTRVGTTLYPNDASWNILTTGNITANQGTLSVDPTTPMQIATKNYVDTHSTPGTGYWNYASGALAPDDVSWVVKSGSSFRAGVADNIAEMVLVSSPVVAGYPAQAFLSNAYYNAATSSYVFKADSTANYAGGYASVGSMGHVYDFAVSEGPTMIDQTISASALYAMNAYGGPGTMMIALFKDDIDLNYGSGTHTGHAVNGATIANGWLDLAHNDNRYVYWDATNNASFTQTGTVKFLVEPSYTGTPTTNTFYLLISKGISGTSDHKKNRITLFHGADGGYAGKLAIWLWDKNGVFYTGIDGWTFPSWSPVAGTHYEFELDMDFTTGVMRLFVDGTQLGATFDPVLLRDTNVGVVAVGTDATNNVSVSNFYMADLVVYNAVQHTANYSHGYNLEFSYLKKLYNGINDRYEFYADTGATNLRFGNQNNEYTYAGSFGETCRTTEATTLGKQTVPISVFGGMYDAKTDNVTVRSDGTNASCLVTVRDTGIAASTATSNSVVKVYAYSTPSAVDIDVPLSTICVEDELAYCIDSFGNFIPVESISEGVVPAITPAHVYSRYNILASPGGSAGIYRVMLPPTNIHHRIVTVVAKFTDIITQSVVVLPQTGDYIDGHQNGQSVIVGYGGAGFNSFTYLVTSAGHWTTISSSLVQNAIA